MNRILDERERVAIFELLNLLEAATVGGTYGAHLRRDAIARARAYAAQQQSDRSGLLLELERLERHLSYNERIKLRAARDQTGRLDSAVASLGGIVHDSNAEPRVPARLRRDAHPSILLLASAQVEYEAAIDIAGVRGNLRQRRRAVGEHIFIDLGLRHCTAWLLRCKSGSVGPNSATVRALDALMRIEPRPYALVAVGIAFGMKPAKQAIGDILIADQLRLYEIVRKGGTLDIMRGDRPAASGVLVDWLHSASADWVIKLGAEENKRPRVHSGLVLSGEKLVDDPDFVSRLLEIEPEAIGGEMEGAGVYSAAYAKRTHWTVVKAICDWGFNKDDRFQVIAARNAFDFVYHTIDQPVIRSVLEASTESGIPIRTTSREAVKRQKR
jgi:nucleoside phosphorylase